ncbi:MAG: hypothetical protein ACXVY9_00440 [Terriglobales bacterium]
MTLLMAWVLTRRQVIHWNMPPWLFWTMWLGFLGLIVLMLYAKSREIKKRREDFQQFAMESGFSYSETGDEALTGQLAEVHVSGSMGTVQLSNVLQGSAGGSEIVIADRTVGSGKTRSTSTVVAFKFEEPLPNFMLCPENVLWRLAEKAGYADIRMEGAPDFSRRFFLHGDNEAAVRALFKPDVTQVLEQLDAKTHLYASAAGRWLVFYPRAGRLIPVNTLRDFLQQTEIIANAFRRARATGAFR